MAQPGILICDDLMFASRITGEARAHGLELRTVRSSAELGKSEPACVIVDLNLAGLDLPALIALVKRQGTCTVVGYGSHVAANVLHQARAAGCDVVMPRSQFVEALPQDLPTWFGLPRP